MAVKRRDDFYMEKMRLKKSGQLEEATAPKFDELFKEEYTCVQSLQPPETHSPGRLQSLG